MNCLYKNLTFFDHYLLKTGNRISFKGFFCVLKHYIVFIFLFFVYCLCCRGGSAVIGLFATVYHLVAVTVWRGSCTLPSSSSRLQFWVPHPI